MESCNPYDVVFAIAAAAGYTVWMLPWEPWDRRAVTLRRLIVIPFFFAIVFYIKSRSFCARLLITLTYGWLIMCIGYPQLFQSRFARGLVVTRLLHAACRSPWGRLGAGISAGLSTVYFVARHIWG